MRLSFDRITPARKKPVPRITGKDSRIGKTARSLVILVSVEQTNDFLNRPDVICDPGFHRWRDPERLMHAPEVVIHEV